MGSTGDYDRSLAMHGMACPTLVLEGSSGSPRIGN
jgi:hypothetical protein